MPQQDTDVSESNHTCSAAEIRMGNIWLIAATVAIGVLHDAAGATGDPALLSVDAQGDMRAIGPEHADYADRMGEPGFVCAAKPNMDVARLAQRLRDAVRRGGAPG